MKMPLEKSQTILVAAISAWLVSLTLILFPTIGLTTPVFPPRPVESYKLLFLVVTTAFASIYSMKMGLNQIFPDGLKIKEKIEAINSYRKSKV